MMSKERPVLFSAPMVRAILEGKKTQTRRIVKLPEQPTHNGGWEPDTIGGPAFEDALGRPSKEIPAIWNRTTGKTLVCPYGAPGDRLWVRETHAQFSVGEGLDSPVPQCVAYRATCDGDSFDYVNGRGEVMRLKVTKWTPAIHMPRWASRITLEVTGVRVERLHDISEDDAKAEGAEAIGRMVHSGVASRSYRQGFDSLWININGQESWDANPWVWVVEFRRVEAQERAA